MGTIARALGRAKTTISRELQRNALPRAALAARLTGKTAAETISAMLAVFGRIDPHLRRSITFDNDPAFAQHGLLRTNARHDDLVLRRLCLMAKRRH